MRPKKEAGWIGPNYMVHWVDIWAVTMALQTTRKGPLKGWKWATFEQQERALNWTFNGPK